MYCVSSVRAEILNLLSIIYSLIRTKPDISVRQTQGNVPGGPVSGQQMAPGRERHTIWQGVLEWLEKAKNPTDTQKLTRHVPCQVSANSKDGEPEL